MDRCKRWIAERLGRGDVWRPARSTTLILLTAAAVGGVGLGITGCASTPPRNGPTAPAAAEAMPVEAADSFDGPAELSPRLADAEWADEVIYFVVVDRFADGDPDNNRRTSQTPGGFHGGDLDGLTRHLDEIAELGVSALWITPVVKNIPGYVTGAGFPDWGYHGYWADDFTQLDPRFGTEDDLRRLVAAAHERGIKVLLDIVYNHAGYDSAYLSTHRSWLRVESAGECGGGDLTSCVAGLPDFRTELQDVRDYLYEAHLGLAERTGLDGFRLDTVKHVDHDFWQQHRQRVEARLGENFYLLGEVWGGTWRSLDEWFEHDEMDAGFDFSFQGSALAFVEGRGRPVAFNRYLEQRHEVREGYQLSHYLASHDTDGALWLLDGDTTRFRMLVVLQMTTFGVPTVYYGEEVGRLGGTWPANRSDMPWGDKGIEPGAGVERDESMREFYRTLIHLRRDHPALWRGSHRGLVTEADQLVYLRHDETSQDAIIVALNRAQEAAEVRFPVPAAWTEDGVEVREVLTGEVVTLQQAQTSDSGWQAVLTVPALDARILHRIPPSGRND